MSSHYRVLTNRAYTSIHVLISAQACVVAFVCYVCFTPTYNLSAFLPETAGTLLVVD